MLSLGWADYVFHTFFKIYQNHLIALLLLLVYLSFGQSLSLCLSLALPLFLSLSLSHSPYLQSLSQLCMEQYFLAI